MVGNDFSVLPNDPGADQTGQSSVFNNIFAQAGQAASDVLRALNAPSMQAQQQKQMNYTTLLWVGGLVAVVWIIWG